MPVKAVCGALSKTEGMIGLNRGLLYAGVEEIISTLFKLYDQSAYEFSDDLFREILKGKVTSEALQIAKQKRIQKTASHPLEWAGYILIGK